MTPMSTPQTTTVIREGDRVTHLAPGLTPPQVRAALAAHAAMRAAALKSPPPPARKPSPAAIAAHAALRGAVRKFSPDQRRAFRAQLAEVEETFQMWQDARWRAEQHAAGIAAALRYRLL